MNSEQQTSPHRSLMFLTSVKCRHSKFRLNLFVCVLYRCITAIGCKIHSQGTTMSSPEAYYFYFLLILLLRQTSSLTTSQSCVNLAFEAWKSNFQFCAQDESERRWATSLMRLLSFRRDIHINIWVTSWSDITEPGGHSIYQKAYTVKNILLKKGYFLAACKKSAFLHLIW